MIEHGSGRAAREQTAYDGMSVFGQSAKLHSRFSHVFQGPNSLAAEALFYSRLKEWSAGADVLECGCYDGGLAEALHDSGARTIIGVDVSPKAIEIARAKRGKLAEFQVMDAAALTFPDNSFDVVLGRAILHHTDFERTLTGIYRVLRPEGHALFMEPLRGNPAAWLIRALTPRARTPDEMPLSVKQIRIGDGLFGSGQHFFANLFSVPVGMVSSLVAKTPDNGMMRVADAVDRALARTALRYWMRVVVLTWEKPHHGYTKTDPSVESTRT